MPAPPGQEGQETKPMTYAPVPVHIPSENRTVYVEGGPVWENLASFCDDKDPWPAVDFVDGYRIALIEGGFVGRPIAPWELRPNRQLAII